MGRYSGASEASARDVKVSAHDGQRLNEGTLGIVGGGAAGVAAGVALGAVAIAPGSASRFPTRWGTSGGAPSR